MPGVGVVTIATGRYGEFLPAFIESARDHVVGLSDICVLADSALGADRGDDVRWLPWGHFSWPYATLMRYRAFDAYRTVLKEFDTILYVDVDMLFVAAVDVAGIAGNFAVLHPHFEGGERATFPYDDNPESVAYVDAQEGDYYFCGGVQGGSSIVFLEACGEIASRIDTDLTRGVVPKVHDESAWNRWCIDNPPERILSSEYCTPETQRAAASRILALDKDHAYFRQQRREDVAARAWRMLRAPFMRQQSPGLAQRKPYG